jgi:type III restriction enzyme
MDKETDSGSAAANAFFEHPILNSPYERPPRHWELDEAGQPTQKIIEQRRSAKFITPIPKPKKRKAASQPGFVFDEGLGLSTKAQAYDPTSIINEVRGYVDVWRRLPNPNQWQVTPETARLLEHWRHHDFSGGVDRDRGRRRHGMRLQIRGSVSRSESRTSRQFQFHLRDVL